MRIWVIVGWMGAVAPGCAAHGFNPADGCSGASQRHAVFNDFWRHLDRHYAVFDEHLDGQSWDQVGAAACPALDTANTDEALYEVILDTARALDDGHLTLNAKDIGRKDDAWVSVYPHYDDMYDLEGHVEEAYLDGDLKWAAKDWFAWGTIGDIGYVSITSMDGLSNGGERKDQDAAAQAMDRVLADFSSTSGLIIDVRANEGGWDTVSLEIARRVAGDRAVAWSKATRDGPEHSDFSEYVETYVEAATANAYDKPVVVLTSGGTFSAAETFVLAMRVRDDVTVMGERSSGHLSDLIDGSMTNGWKYTYSGERYKAADGNVYEAVGVPVDELVPFDPDAFAAGTDTMLESALTRLGQVR